MRKLTRHLTIAAVSTVALALTACMSSGSNPAAATSEDPGYATVLVSTKTKNVNRLSKPGLGKAAAIELKNLVVEAISDAATPDTVTVTLAVGDSGFAADPTQNQNVAIVLELKALRNWTISARTIDQNDSVIQEGDTTTGTLYAGQVKTLPLIATPNYTMYTAKFNFPDSISSQTGNVKQSISLTKAELLIDGVLRADTTGTLVDSARLSYDYVPSSAGTVTLKVYGNIENGAGIDPLTDTAWSTGSHLLFLGSVAVSELDANQSNVVPLVWQGPAGGSAELTVEIKAVGKVDIDGTIDPVVLPKKQ